MLERRPRRLGLVVLAGALLVLFHRLLLGEVFFWGLPALQFYPWREYAFDLLRQGQLPLWNPYNGAGAPLLANYQSALLYPLNWPGFFLPLAWSMSVTAVLHLFIGGLGMTALLRCLGAGALGQGMAALAFALTGYLVARLGTYPMISAAVWLPWLVWVAHGMLLRYRFRDAGRLALIVALLLLAGHAQTAWYSLLLAILYGVWLVVNRRLPFARLVVMGLIASLGAGIAALQLVPTAELLLTSQRAAGVDYDFAMNFSFGLARSLNFLSPITFGTPADGSYLVTGYYFEFAVYIGLIPLVSAFAAVVGWLQRRRERDQNVFTIVPFWLIIALIGFVLAMGAHTPVFPFLYRHVPTFDLFQAPARWQLWTVFSLAVLSGIGVSAWGRSFRARRWAKRLFAACLSLLVLSLIALVAAPPIEGVQALVRALLGLAVSGIAGAWLALRQPPADSAAYSRWSLLVLVIVAADLVWANWGHNPTIPAAFYDPLGDQSQSQARGYWSQAAEDALKYQTFFRPDDYRFAAENWQMVRASNLPNLNLIDRRALLDNFDPLLVGPYAAFINALDAAEPNRRESFFVASAVGWVYGDHGGSVPSGIDPARAWLVPGVCWHASEEALLQALADGADLTRQVHIPGDGPCPPPPETIERGTVLIGDEANRVELVVHSPYDGWLVLADTDYPGWQATIDGLSVPIYRANGAFRAIQMPPGEHVVSFSYEPSWLVPAGTVSALSFLVAVALLLLKADSKSLAR